MSFGFEPTEPDRHLPPTTPPSNSTPKSELKWVPLQNHPLFSSPTSSVTTTSAAPRTLPNLLAWDGASRLYVWDSQEKCLHRASIRLGETDPNSILAAYPSKVLRTDTPLSFEVNKISINRNGSALLLAGLEDLCVMFLYGRSSMEENTIICRTVLIGSEIFFKQNNFIRVLQVLWHPYSDTHLGILSSDSVFRIFDLSASTDQPEQEYYLQPLEPGPSANAAGICPVDFSFGKDHLWDKFSLCMFSWFSNYRSWNVLSRPDFAQNGKIRNGVVKDFAIVAVMLNSYFRVFVLFSDGSIYIICPVVPFGSVYIWDSILEMYNDAQNFGLKSANSIAVNNSNLAITWLEATFPELSRRAGDRGDLFAVKAQPFVLLNASVSLQGPLCKVCDDTSEGSEIPRGVCEGRAVSFLYNLAGKDSVLVTAWGGGQLQLDALADEIQPVWKIGSAPRLCVDSSDQIHNAAMICESSPSDRAVLKLDQPPSHTVWSGLPPPLLRLAFVDLALPDKRNSIVAMIADPLLPERIFCIHAGGIDSIVLHFLPFTNQATSNKEEPMRTPSVLPVLNTCLGESSSLSPLHGFLALSDSFGSSWIVGLSSSRECVVVQMDTWNLLLTNAFDKAREIVLSEEEQREMDTPAIISPELLSGPKAVLLPTSPPNSRTVTADSIEGRSMLHQYFKLFHENYVEYAHKVYFELQHHGPHLKKIIDSQQSRVRSLQQKLLEVEKKQEKIETRIDHVVQVHSSLEERLRKLRSLSGSHRKPLSKAERDFKLELDRFTGVELEALHSSIEALRGRLLRHVHSPQRESSNQPRQGPRRRVNRFVEDEVSLLKSSLAKLSLLNSANSKKVKLVDSALKDREIVD